MKALSRCGNISWRDRTTSCSLPSIRATSRSKVAYSWISPLPRTTACCSVAETQRTQWNNAMNYFLVAPSPVTIPCFIKIWNTSPLQSTRDDEQTIRVCLGKEKTSLQIWRLMSSKPFKEGRWQSRKSDRSPKMYIKSLNTRIPGVELMTKFERNFNLLGATNGSF